MKALVLTAALALIGCRKPCNTAYILDPKAQCASLGDSNGTTCTSSTGEQWYCNLENCHVLGAIVAPKAEKPVPVQEAPDVR